MLTIKEPDFSDTIELVNVHSRIFDYSFTTRLGMKFLEKVYYPGMLELNHVFIKIFLYNKKIAGFVVCSTDANHVFSTIVRRKLFCFLSITFLGIMKNPIIIKDLFRALFFVLFGQKELLPRVNSEIVNMGVLPEYRRMTMKKGILSTTEFYKVHGINLAQELFNSVLEEFRKRNIREFKVLTPADKKDSNKFYEKAGCRLVGENIKILGHYSNCLLFTF